MMSAVSVVMHWILFTRKKKWKCRSWIRIVLASYDVHFAQNFISIFWELCYYTIPVQYTQVFDSPSVKILVGKRTRRRLDAKSIVQLVRSFDAPVGICSFSPLSLQKCTKHVLDLLTKLHSSILSSNYKWTIVAFGQIVCFVMF